MVIPINHEIITQWDTWMPQFSYSSYPDGASLYLSYLGQDFLSGFFFLTCFSYHRKVRLLHLSVFMTPPVKSMLGSLVVNRQIKKAQPEDPPPLSSL
jgi:hypothetical protein